MKKETIKGYKGFDKGLKCRDFQYKENTTFTTKEKPELCESGFHFCENPLDVLDYYNLCDSEFTEVEAIGKTKSDNQKTVTNKIKIGLKIDLKSFIKASIDFIWEKCKVSEGENVQAASGNSSQLAASGDSSQLAASGYYSQLAASGDYSQLAASGNSSQLAASGDYSKLAASGYSIKLAASGYSSKLAASGDSSQLAASGNSSQLAASGYYSQLAASGYYSKLAASGDSSKLAASGNSSKLAASGDSSKLELSGKDSVGANIGIKGIIKAFKGCWITLAEYDNNNKILCVKSTKVTGKTIKSGIWYKLIDGKFTEV